MRTLLVCEPGFLIGNNKLGVKVCWRVLRQDKGKADVACVLILMQASSDTELGAMHCPLTPRHAHCRQRHNPSTRTPHPPPPSQSWDYTLVVSFPVHPTSSPGPSETAFHFTNICWQREIPNLSRAFFQISSLRLNADFSYCGAAVYYFIVPSLFAGD